jgi:hypothetical protein
MDKNFSVKVTLAEANIIKHALQFYLTYLTNTTTDDMPDVDYKLEARNVDNMLRRDF